MRDMIQAILASPVPVARLSRRTARAPRAPGTYHALCEPHGGDGAGNEPRCRDAGADRRRRPPAPRAARRARAATTAEQDDAPPPAHARAATRWSARRSTTRSPTSAASPSCAAATPTGPSARCARPRACRASQALEREVIDVIAADVADLLAQLDGRAVNGRSARERVLATPGSWSRASSPTGARSCSRCITNPNVAYLLMLIGIYGLIFEGYNPGASCRASSARSACCSALYAFQVLPVNYAGLALIAARRGADGRGERSCRASASLGIGGIVAFVIGSVILIDTDVPGFGVSAPLIGGDRRRRRARCSADLAGDALAPAAGRERRRSDCCGRGHRARGLRARRWCACTARAGARRSARPCTRASACASRESTVWSSKSSPMTRAEHEWTIRHHVL